jgi:hypothetical protein
MVQSAWLVGLNACVADSTAVFGHRHILHGLHLPPLGCTSMLQLTLLLSVAVGFCLVPMLLLVIIPLLLPLVLPLCYRLVLLLLLLLQCCYVVTV